MTIKRQQPGPRMSAAVVHTVYLAGQVPGDQPTVKGQTADVLKKIDGLLASVGSDKSKLLSATIYLANMAFYNEMNEVWDGWVSAGNTPARATVEARLAAPTCLVEISVVAAL